MKQVKRTSTGEQSHRREYEQLKRQLRGIGYICLGSIVQRWVACGKEACACHHDPAKRHGPYYQWTRKIRGRTQSRLIPESLIRQYREGMRNHRRVDRILERMREISLRAIEADRKRG